jgi:hypothetical protein
MKYRLVLQFLVNSIADFDRLVALETKLIEELDLSGVVDGHDFGSGKFNIFVLTNEPATTFNQAHQVIVNETIPNDLRSAYREMSGEEYVVVWPSTLPEFSLL